MREELIQAMPRIRAFFWGAAIMLLIGIVLTLGAGQRYQHAANRQAINAVDLAWEICRAAEGRPVYHESGGWIRDTGIEVTDGAFRAGDWVWADSHGKLGAWPGPEDDGVDDSDACGEGWRAGYSAAVPEVKPR